VALVLAGRRGGQDPLSVSTGATHKALVPLGGVPMVLRVVRTLLATPSIAAVAVSIDDPGVLERLPELAELVRRGQVEVHRSLESPSASVSDFFSRCPAGTTLLATTADHPLLTSEIVAYFLEQAARSEADLVVGVVSESCFRAQFPDARRTRIRLRDDSYGGANLFALRGARATAVTQFWVRAEKHRKKPWRLVAMFGLGNLVRFVMARLDLDEAMRRASQRVGARIEAIRMPFAVCAVDVDGAEDVETALAILAARGEIPA